ncbi:MAG: hypothetical protein HY401_01715, partial [Elusimicrobia bacterium]|nr:hypothetical protein [Elusimicrobiota bacterium]
PLNPVAEAVRRARGTWGAGGAAPRGPASTRGEPSGLVLGSGGKGGSPAPNPYIIEFDEPQRAPSPGQFAVFYDEERLLGGGKILIAKSAVHSTIDRERDLVSV